MDVVWVWGAWAREGFVVTAICLLSSILYSLHSRGRADITSLHKWADQRALVEKWGEAGRWEES